MNSLISFFVSILLILHLARGQNNSQSSCPESFKCGSIDNMSYPFSRDPKCGLCVVDCDAKPGPKINLSSEGDWYIDGTYISTNINSITVHSPRLENKGCHSFDKNITLPSTASISFTILHNITLFKCNISSSSPTFHDHFDDSYEKFTICEDDGFHIYYTLDRDRRVSGTLPPSCSIIQLPAKPFPLISDPKDLYNILSMKFDLEWRLSIDCDICHGKGHRCLTDNENKFNCSQGIGESTSTPEVIEKQTLKVILGAVLGGVAFIILLIAAVGIFIMWRRKKKSIKSKYLLSRNTSSDPSSRADIEGGSGYHGVPVFSYTELEEVTNNFDSSKELGDGGFGVVYYGKLRDGREVAVKRLYEHNYKRVQQFMNEIKILTSLKHPNLVTLYGCTSRRSRELLLVYEYVPNGTVADHLHGDREKYKLLGWPIRMNIAIETASALTYLHASDIIHRDIKTNNILLDHNFSVKVADFGLSRLFPTDVTHVSTAPQGTPGYVDPEYHECYQLTDKSDVYSFGVVLVELISSMPAVDITRHRHEINLANLAINRIQRCAFDELIDSSLGYETDPAVKRMTMLIAELAFRCLQLDKELRPTMDEVYETLVDIKESKEDIKAEKTKKIPHSPETDDDAALLKNVKLPPPSPDTVTVNWNSSSSTIDGS